MSHRMHMRNDTGDCIANGDYPLSGLGWDLQTIALVSHVVVNSEFDLIGKGEQNLTLP
jgi:hypothetical protein